MPNIINRLPQNAQTFRGTTDEAEEDFGAHIEVVVAEVTAVIHRTGLEGGKYCYLVCHFSRI